jgi:hypothetical protein
LLVPTRTPDCSKKPFGVFILFSFFPRTRSGENF